MKIIDEPNKSLKKHLGNAHENLICFKDAYWQNQLSVIAT